MVERAGTELDDRYVRDSQYQPTWNTTERYKSNSLGRPKKIKKVTEIL